MLWTMVAGLALIPFGIWIARSIRLSDLEMDRAIREFEEAVRRDAER